MQASTQVGMRTSSLKHALHVVWYRAIAELRAEATRTYAGYLWWIIQPLLMFAVYYIAFRYVLDLREEHFAIFLFTGIIIWQWFSVTVLRCSGSLITSRGLMLQVNLHKSVFPFSILLVNTVKFLVTLVILIIVLTTSGFPPGIAWLALPALLVVQLVVIAGFACFSAMISPFVPDFQHILATLLHLAFFVSGVIYDLSVLPEKYQRVLSWNPMSVVISQFRRVLMDNQLPQLGELIAPFIISVTLLVISLILIHRFDKLYPKLSS
jgi:lipopolysaccharide transport system permease protein